MEIKDNQGYKSYKFETRRNKEKFFLPLPVILKNSESLLEYIHSTTISRGESEKGLSVYK